MKRKKHRSVKNHGEYYPNMDLKVFRNLIKQLGDSIIASSKLDTHGVKVRETLRTYQVTLYLKKNPKSPELGRELGNIIHKFILKHCLSSTSRLFITWGYLKILDLYSLLVYWV